MFGNELFGKDKNGGYKIWGIEVEELFTGDGAITRTYYGKEGGDYALTTDTELTYEGKQKRSPYEQAVHQAQAKIKKKLDAGYRETKKELEEVPLLPMLAENHHKSGHRMKWEEGVDISDKLDGLRNLVKVTYCNDRQHSVIAMTSRTGQPYSVPHIERALHECRVEAGDNLDGEIYYHGASLQDITSAVKRTDTQKEIDKVLRDIARLGEDYRRPSKVAGVESPTLAEELEHAEYIHWLRPRLTLVLFDVAVPGMPWHMRLEQLNLFKSFVASPFIEVISYTRVYSEEEMFRLHDDARERGFEGVMERNRHGDYESGKRSADLQKYKQMVGDNVEDKDTEFLVIGMKADKNGNGVYICKNDLNDMPFSVVWGSFKERLEALQNADKIIGKKYLTVNYQTRYDRTLLPQFPAGKGLREGQIINGEFVPSE